MRQGELDVSRTEKVWKFKYKDVIEVTPDTIEIEKINQPTTSRTAKNHPGWNAPILHDKNGKDCYIYSDREIKGLELVGENVRLG